jgi:hypothetical protein
MIKAYEIQNFCLTFVNKELCSPGQLHSLVLSHENVSGDIYNSRINHKSRISDLKGIKYIKTWKNLIKTHLIPKYHDRDLHILNVFLEAK